MASLTALNKIIKLQRLLINAHNSFLACSTYVSSLPPKIMLQKQQKIRLQQCQSTTTCISNSTLDRLIVTPSQQLNERRSFSSTQSPTIDEFRAREEQREEEFYRKQSDEEERKRSNVEDAEKQAKVDAIRSQILEAALVHVPTLGWTRHAIVQGAEDAGFPSVVHGMFPDGGFALVSYFYGKSNDELIERLRNETQHGQKEIANPLEFLVHAVRMRLEMIAPYKAQWPQALALIAVPQNASTALAQVLTLVDDICYYSGDRSVDIGWYTRRIGLATIMKMTELYMLQDSSPNHSNTWEFLKNRMDEAVQLQMILSSTDGVTHNFQRSFNSAFITARNILGLDYTRR